MLRLWDVDNELVAACVEHISSKRLQDNLAKIEKLQVSERSTSDPRFFHEVLQADRLPSAKKLQDFMPSIDTLSCIVRLSSKRQSRH